MASVYSVSQVNSYIKNMFAQDFALSRITVRGEVSNCKYHTSGHIYFTLKDGTGTLAAVMFAGQRKGLLFQLQEGQKVVVTGSVDVYERDGKYQLYARKIEEEGRGDLYQHFLKLRDELEEMGMFAPEYKQPIPQYAKTIGVVTAPTGAAIRDIINITHRRNPYVQLILYPALVQGTGAAASVAAGIRTLDQMGVDIIIAGRGGGSIEDLWAFNEEIVARAIFDCATPVISAVGHETDVTIADYVADLRAPTPSAAAELAVFDYRQFETRRLSYQASFDQVMQRKTELARYKTEQYRLKLKLHDPGRTLREQRQRLADTEDAMRASMHKKLTEARHRLELMSGQLHGLSPLAKISNGYGFLTDANGKRLASVSQTAPGEEITLRITDGRIRAKVTEVTAYPMNGKIEE